MHTEGPRPLTWVLPVHSWEPGWLRHASEAGLLKKLD